MNANPRPADAMQASFAPLTTERLDALLAVEQAAYSHPWTRGNFIDALAAGYQAQLLVAGGQILGYFVAMPGVQEAHLLNITVAPAHQRQGWARFLLDALCLWSRGQRAQWLWLEVRASNAPARALYTGYGFQQVGIRKGYYPAGQSHREDAVVMSLNLMVARVAGGAA